MNVVQSFDEDVRVSPKRNSPQSHRRMTAPAIQFQGYDHVGIRVTDPQRALDFYGKLGFRLDPDFSSDDVAEIVAEDGTRLNLIFNGVLEPITSCLTSR